MLRKTLESSVVQMVEQVHVYDSSCFFVWSAVFLERLFLLLCS